MSLNARDFTQGGQVMKYMIGMFMQIMNIASYWMLMFSVAVFFLWMFLTLSLQTFCHGGAYWLIKWLIMPFKNISGKDSGGSWTFHFERPDGDVVTFKHTAQQVMTDPYFIQMGQAVKNAAFYGWGLAAFTFVGSIFAITWYLGSKGKKQRDNEQVGGRDLVEGPEELNRLLKKAGMQSPLNICGLHIVKDSEPQNFGLHGTVGSGKSTALNNLLRQLRARGDRVIIYDKGNNFIPLFFRQDKDKILNPFDARCAPWDLWAECQTVTDFENFATTLLPDSNGGGDPFWVLSARALFVATARRMAKEKDRNIAGLLKKLMSISLADLRDYLQGTDAANLVDGSIEKTAMTIRTILTTYARSLRYLQGLDQQGRQPFNIRDWLATEDADGDNPWIFVASDGRSHNAIKPLLSAWLYMTMTGILGLTASRERRIWLFLDEVPSLHKLPILPEYCAEGRKFGGCALLGLQNFPQLKEQFGPNFAEAIWDLLNTRIFYRAPSGPVAEWVQREIGERRHKKFRDQYSYGVDIIRDGVQFSKDEVNEYLVSYSDIQSLNDLECYITLPGEWPVVRMKLKREPFRQIAEGRIDRNVEDLFDPELEEQMAEGDAAGMTGQIVERLFADAAAEGSTVPVIPAATSGDKDSANGEPPAGNHEPEGRETSPPPVSGPENGECRQDGPSPVAQAVPVGQMESVQDVRHRSSDEDFGVKL
ncbi:type IV conjugative transfer system coupling protein TraD [Erwinia sp. OLTSP20]|uniref:type IV conjugative transfer system coupling protein TraD n=1 Tax=unclassified Erwinia TaxID=2622719 RepID=UPI000C179BA2|nr:MULTISPECIES: type IV conjugative transfer system coupling protein TraD [unclassified Erwinia]PIJ50042.1 type IV conjugative transfer system coupling protein TraD [Erwinia sp. OAMSP11]PIJ72412.1 type IV conjugative transfer system coupling protein TraD [Erwinia sp. OLSSP12]PIJ80035.1 type IV conjugative transfer system coupling protein TraD [Erwinia sp. OLCASP19]PIJ82167.1 type IV conjugative transfer system coupling protein TraD [Erwinia sp. OLMTSP26]PIJ86403.1 type IV conjugative transfer